MLLGRVLAVTLCWALSAPVYADGFDANLNNTAVQVRYNYAASDIIEGNSALHAGILYNDSNNIFVDAGIKVNGGGEEAGAPGPIMAMGVKGVFAQIHRPLVSTIDYVSAISIGAEFGYAIPTAVPVAFVLEYFGSTKILTFGEADRFTQFGLRMEILGSPQAKAYLAYREIGFGIRSYGSAVLDSGSILGVSAAF